VTVDRLTLPIHKLGAFADRLFRGGPTAVCVLDADQEAALDDATMQAVATENNLGETAFIGRRGKDWWIRWFTPVCMNTALVPSAIGPT